MTIYFHLGMEKVMVALLACIYIGRAVIINTYVSEELMAFWASELSVIKIA